MSHRDLHLQGWQSVGPIRFPDPGPTEISRPGSCSDLEIYSKAESGSGSFSSFQLSVGPVYFKDLPGKSRVGLCGWSDYPIEMGSALIKLKLGRFPISMGASRLIGGLKKLGLPTGSDSVQCL